MSEDSRSMVMMAYSCLLPEVTVVSEGVCGPSNRSKHSLNAMLYASSHYTNALVGVVGILGTGNSDRLAEAAG